MISYSHNETVSYKKDLQLQTCHEKLVPDPRVSDDTGPEQAKNPKELKTTISMATVC